MNFLFHFLLLIFCFSSLIYCRFENRILHGEETPFGQYMFITKVLSSKTIRNPYSGIIRTTSMFGECSSTIISKRHILTAAHCVVSLDVWKNDKNYFLTIALSKPWYIDTQPIEKYSEYVVDLKKFGIASKAYIHRGYNHQSVNDIAIIEFPEDTNFNITPITLAKDYVDNYDDTVIAAGYGNYIWDVNTQQALFSPSTTLRDVKIKIRPIADCFNVTEVYRNLNPANIIRYKYYTETSSNEKRQICAGNSGEFPQRIDSGDSGGPLMYELNGKIYQLGVASGSSTINIKAPANYMRISYYCGWIEKVTKGEVKCQSLKE